MENKEDEGNAKISDDKEAVEEKTDPFGNVEDTLQEWVSSGATWLNSAKLKAFTTLELVKKDLAEFGDAVANEASALANSTVVSVKHQAQNLQQIMSLDEEMVEDCSQTTVTPAEAEPKASGFSWTPKLPPLPSITNTCWMKTIFDTVKNIAQEDTTANEDSFTEVLLPHSKKSAAQNDLPHHVLYSIQTNSDTFTNPPEGDEDLFKIWVDSFILEEHDNEITTLLANCPPMRALYQELVPSVVENATFWKRYFYKVYKAEQLARYKIERSKQLAKRAEIPTDEQDATDSDEKGAKLETAIDSATGHVSPDRRSNTDESWSVCSSINVDLQENHDDMQGPLTPKANESTAEEKSDGWVKWDE